MEYIITPCGQAERQEILAGLLAYNDQFIPPREDLSLQIRIDGRCAAGVIAHSRGDCAAVEILWVDQAFRGRGLGTALLEQVEAQGRARGAVRLVLDTFAFQAPRFYERLGYRRFGQVEPYVNGYGRYYYVKDLKSQERETESKQ